MAAVALIACSGDAAPVQLAAPAATASAAAPAQSAAPSATATATPAPVIVDGESLSLPPSLPRIDGVVQSATLAVDGSIAVSWLVDASPGAVVAAIAEAVAARLTLLLDERGSGGGLVVFEGLSVAGHYLVTAAGGDARVELRLDAPPPPATAAALAQPLPVGYPAAAVPVFPGATVVSGSSEALTAQSTRFVLTLETERPPLDVLGFYRDLFESFGWETVVRELELDASGAGGALTLTVTPGARTRAVLRLEWTASSE
ncbi:MAG: hypothetical protein V3R95_03110 [Dehalococcoidia bacterium]